MQGDTDQTATQKTDPNRHPVPHTPDEKSISAIREIRDQMMTQTGNDRFSTLSTEEIIALIKKMSTEKETLTKAISDSKKEVQRRIGAM